MPLQYVIYEETLMDREKVHSTLDKGGFVILETNNSLIVLRYADPPEVTGGELSFSSAVIIGGFPCDEYQWKGEKNLTEALEESEKFEKVT